MKEPYQVLEYEWATWNNLDPEKMVVCSSGTAALHLAMEIACPVPGSIIMPDFTMVACPRAAVLADHQPIFIDCDDSLRMCAGEVNRCIKYDTRGVLVAHIYGRRGHMHTISNICETNKLKLIEDLAEAHGIYPHEKTDAACWSFYKNKIVSGEEGGAVYFKKIEHAMLARRMRSLGFTEEHNFMHVPRGHNYRLSNVHADLILRSLNCANSNLKRREYLEKHYQKCTPEEWRMPKRDVPWVYDIRIPGMSYRRQDDLVMDMRPYGMRHAFKPMRMQPEFRCNNCEETNARKMGEEVVYLPLHPSIKPAQIEDVMQILCRYHAIA